MNTLSEDALLVARFTNYLKAVVRFARIDHFRQNKRYYSDQIRQFIETDEVVEFDHLYAALRSPQTEFEFEDPLFTDAFRQLKELHQSLLLYTFIDGLSEEEIAEHLGCEPDYVRKIRYRALSRMRQLLKRGGAL